MVAGGGLAGVRVLANSAVHVEGKVDRTAVIYVHGDSIEMEDGQGSVLPKQMYRFYGRLPDSRQDVRLRVLKNRGSVRISQQPRLENNYTAAVTIEDLQDGPGFYSIALDWNQDRGSEFDPEPGFNRRSEVEHLEWHGRVDGEVIVECRATTCRSVVQSGARVMKEKFKFSRPLPQEPVTAPPIQFGDTILEETQGRGDSPDRAAIGTQRLHGPRACSRSGGRSGRVLIRGRVAPSPATRLNLARARAYPLQEGKIMQQHVKILGILNIIYGSIGVLIGLFVFAVLGGIAQFVWRLSPPRIPRWWFLS